jgi:methanogenic corrinoid protein MtbC1
MERMDSESFEQTLIHAAANLGLTGLLEGVIIPFVEIIGVRWVAGTATIAQEHLVSAILRKYLVSVLSTMRTTSQAPRLLVTTPTNQTHEIGGLIVSVVASMQGWNVIYLGANLPAIEIANATRQCAAHAVGLSLVYPHDDPTLPDELSLLRRTLGSAVPILVGGRAANSYSVAIDSIGAHNVQTISALRESLDQIRRGANLFEN